MSIKKLIAKAGLVASLLAGATGAYAQDIKVALGTDGFVHMPLFVAVDGGYFKKQGMNVELVKFKGGGAATSGLASRTVEFLFLCDPELDQREIEGRRLDPAGAGWWGSTQATW